MEKNQVKQIFDTPTRQSPVAIFLIIQKLIEQIVRQFWPIFLVIILNNLDFQTKTNGPSEDPYWTKILFALGAFSAVGSIIAYFKFYYYVQDDEFVIEKGLLQKKKINIPFDRIQTINFEQNLIHRAFGVVSLEVDSAGSVQKEITLQAISRDKAEALRSFIMAEKAKNRSLSIDKTIAEVPIFKEEPAEVLVQLNPIDLLKVGLSQNHFRGLGIILGFAFWIFQTLEDFFPSYKEGENPIEYLEKDLGLGALISIWVYLIVAIAIISILISLILTLFQHFNLRFFQHKTGFKVVSGLFTKREASANINKIQLIRWQDSILKRIFGLFNLGLFQASSAAVNTRQSINVPGCYIDQIQTVRDTYFPDEKKLNYTTHQISPLIIGRRVLYLGGIPALVILIFAYLNQDYFSAIWAPIWMAFIYFTSKVFHQNWKFHLSEEGLLTENGILGTNFTLLKWYKVQAVKTRQSIYQKRRDLADVYFYTAAGSVKIPYISLEKAQKISNYVLYKVEVEEKHWM